MTGDGTPSELRKLAENVLRPGHRADYAERKLARGLLSALDALEAAKRKARYEQGRALAWEVRRENAEASRDQAVFELEVVKEELRFVRTSRDQAIKERDEAREALRELNAWVSRMPDAGFAAKDPRWGWWNKRPALAGVPGEANRSKEGVRDE